MRPSHKSRNRNRHRSSGGGGSSGGNPLNRVYESNGPDVKVRGTAQTIADKYLQLGRDAQSSGDSVMAESYYQHAEHYLRIIMAAQAYNQQIQQQYRRPDEEFDDEDLEDVPEVQQGEPRGGQAPQGAEAEGTGEQPQIQGDGGDRSQQQQRSSRDQNGQSYQSRDKDRSRSRWQDRRDQGRDGGDQRRDGGDQRRSSSQGATTDQPAPSEDQASPVVAKSDGKSEDQWEAPSFLRRPAAAAPEPVAAEEKVATPAAEVAAEAPAEAKTTTQKAPAKRRSERKPRSKEPAEEVAAADAPTVSD